MQEEPETTVGIAVIGMAGRFPGADSIADYWRNLRRGVESIRHFGTEELRAAGVSEALLASPRYVRAKGVLSDVAGFDADFFGFSAREAATMDPQHRLFLETAWTAFESAGYDPHRADGWVGVYAGSGGTGYRDHLLQGLDDLHQGGADPHVFFGNYPDFLATRTAYKLGLEGPAVVVRTACSTSLVAVAMACQALLDHQCDLALAGGSSIRIPAISGYLYEEGGIPSPDGHCRAFDRRAAGTVLGDGVGAVVLKRLDEALRDRDPILAVVRGFGLNNDGADKVGYTAPSIQGQAEAIALAHEMAGGDYDAVGYVEAHGTGTPLGDPVEVAALTRAFRQGTERHGFCALGSVKTNLGHLDAAAGIAGFIKTVLALHHGEIPPSLHFEEPNPKIDFADSPFFVQRELSPWTPGRGPRRAGISSFGIGGTNAHIVLEEAPAGVRPASESGNGAAVCLPLSARTPGALDRLARALADHLESHPQDSLGDIAYTLQVGRAVHPLRRAVVSADRATLIARLRRGDDSTADPLPDHELEVLARRWRAGEPVDWQGRERETLHHRLALPTYPFEHRRHWVDRSAEPPPLRSRASEPRRAVAPAASDRARPPATAIRADTLVPRPPLPRRQDPAEWLYGVTWRASLPVAPPHSLDGPWLFLLDDRGWTARLVARLPAGIAKVEIRRGPRSHLESADRGVLDPRDANGFHALLAGLDERGRWPRRIVVGWFLDPTGDPGSGPRDSFESLLFLAQALAGHSRRRSVDLTVLATDLHRIETEDVVDPAKAPHLGPLRVLPLEVPGVSCRSLDVGPLNSAVPDAPETPDDVESRLQSWLWEAASPTDGAVVVAHRGGRRFEQSFERLDASESLFDDEKPVAVRPGALVVVAGGLGGVGRAVAHQLAEHGARLVLLGRTPLPPRHEWRARLATPPPISDWADTLEASRRAWRQRLGLASLADFPRFEKGLRQLCLAHVASLIEPVFEPGSTRRQILDRLAAIPPFERLVDRMLDLACRGGLLTGSLEGFERGSWKPVAPAATLSRALRRGFPQLAGLVELLDHCAAHAGDVIAGRKPGLAVLYPDGSAELVERSAERTVEHRSEPIYREMLAERVAALARGLERPLRVLEIGAGSGLLTRTLVSHCQGLELELLVTDVSPRFVQRLADWAESAGHRQLRTAVFDISEDPRPQGLAVAAFDVVVGLNVVHATPRIEATLFHLESLLAPSGILALVEATQTPPWVDLVWGLTTGWWHFEDTPLRRRSPLLPAQDWCRLLRRRGFEQVVSLADPDAGDDGDATALLVAQIGARRRPGWEREADPDDRLRHTLEQLSRLEEQALELQIHTVDVTDRTALATTLDTIRQSSGPIHGVVHCAMVLDDGMMVGETRRRASRVLAPKIEGTRNLFELTDGPERDFFVLSSSLASSLGLFAQADYCAANAFQDAFAQAYHDRDAGAVVSIGWGIWRDSGAAMRLLMDTSTSPPPRCWVDHPLLDGRIEVAPGRWVFNTRLSPRRHWILHEHRLDGTPWVPGTAYFELVRGAFAHLESDGPVELRDVTLHQPLEVPEVAGREVRVVLERAGEGHGFEVLSQSSEDAWRLHCRGMVLRPDDSAPRHIDPRALARVCPHPRARPEGEPGRLDDGTPSRRFGPVTVGPRWHGTALDASFGPGQGLASLALAEEHQGDLESYPLHPALLDLATSFALEERDFYLPFGYGRLRYLAPLGARIWVHCRYLPPGPTAEDTLSYDLLLCDSTGRLCAEIEGYRLRRVRGGRPTARSTAITVASPDLHPELREGMSWREGSEILGRLLAAPAPQVLVSTQDFEALSRRQRERSITRFKTSTLPRLRAEVTSHGTSPEERPGEALPDGATEHTAESLTPQVLEVFRQVLGEPSVTEDDDFFALHGDSLQAVMVTSRLLEATGYELSPDLLFDHPTARGVARELAHRLGDRGTAPAVRATETPPASAERPSGETPRATPSTESPSELPDGDRRAAIPRRPETGREAPCSSGQERLWFHQQLEPASTAYNMPEALDLLGPLDPGTLRRAVREVVRRHAVLRTLLPAADGRPYQRIAPIEDFCALPMVDLSSLPPSRGEREAGRGLRRLARRPFALEREHPLRTALFRLGDSDRRSGHHHRAVFCFHHVASDGWSRGLFFRELELLYAPRAGNPATPRTSRPALPELPIQYADYATWQRERSAEIPPDAMLPPGVAELDDAAWQVLERDRAGKTGRRGRGAAVEVVVGSELRADLESRAHRAGVSPFILQLAVFTTLLHRQTDRSRIALGTLVANRSRSELESLIGFFVNTLIVVDEAEPDDPFGHHLRRTAKRWRQLFRHHAIPFERVVEKLAPERPPGRPPLVQVLFIGQTAPGRELVLDGLRVRELELGVDQVHFDLTVSVYDSESGLRIRLTYNAECFHRTTVLRLGRRFATLLRAMVEKPDQSLAQLPLLTAGERHQILREWSTPASDHRGVAALWPRRFADQCRRTPDAPAIVGAGGTRTYRQVAERAAALAATLRRLGVGPDMPVVLALPPVPARVWALLAVLEAGGAFVLTEVETPPDRLRQLLATAQGPVVLAWGRSLERTAATLGGDAPRILDLSRPSTIGEAPNAFPPPALEPHHLAYVAYTSGSSGRPKGVMVSHQALIHYLDWVNDTLSPSGSRIPATTSPAFDACLKQLLAPLLRGDPVWLVDTELARRPDALRRQLAASPGAVFNAVPAVWSELLDTFDTSATTPELSALLLGGERLEPELVAATRRHLPDVRIVNLYGPTEATANVSSAVVRGSTEVTLGRPRPGCGLWVLDRQGRPSPIGHVGELAISGIPLARGYLGDPAATAERFRPHPSARPQETGARLYHSGDRVRWRGDGELEFLGRRDRQLKLRGVRIEPGDIETALAAHPAIRAARVEMRPLAPGGPEALVAFCETTTSEDPAETPAPTAAELRTFLAHRLPAAMLPATFELLDRLPRTAAGKIDRSALPTPGRTEPGSRTLGEDPQADLLAEIWCSILGHDRIGGADDFFALGGHSLLATRMVARIRQVFGVDLPLRQLFETPTLGGLAKAVAAARRRARPPLPPLVRGRRDHPLPLTHAQRRLWFLQQLEPASTAYTLPRAHRLRGALAVGALRRALSRLVGRHEVLRTRFPAIDGRAHQQIDAPGPFPLPMLDLRPLADRAEAESQQLLAAAIRRPFDLGCEAPLRALLIRLAEHEHILFLQLHHIASDGASRAILDRELDHFYRAATTTAGTAPPPLDELELQVADFAIWQRRWLDGPVVDDLLTSWRQRPTEPTILELPTDRPRSANRSGLGGQRSLALDRGASERIEALGRRQGCSRFMSHLAVFLVLLHRLTGQVDLWLGTPISNRRHRATEGLIGCFVNTLVLRGDLTGRPSFESLLLRVRELCLDAYDHQDLPFERLVELLEPDRDLGRSPLFQVLFSLAEDVPPPALGELVTEPFELATTILHFDLAITLGGTPEVPTIHWSFDTDLFDPTTIERLARCGRVLMASLSETPDRPIDTHALLSTAARHQLSIEWNDTETPEPGTAMLHGGFALRVRHDPGSVAVVAVEREVRYGELAEMADTWARRLKAWGVGPGDRVGVLLESSAERVAILLSILGRGAAYVPLDPEAPAARLEAMLDALAITGERPLVVSEGPLARGLSRRGHHVVDRLAVEIGRSEIDGPSPFVAVSPDSPAYLLHTSGTTGEPKAVVVSHRSATDLLAWMARDLGIGADDRILHKTPLTFDVSMWEVFLPLTLGGRLVLAAPGGHRDPRHLVSRIREQSVTTLHLVPTMLRAFLVELETTDLPSVTRVFSGGEPLDGELVGRFARRFDPAHTRFFNLYGPTEATVDATWWPVPLDLPESRRNEIAIGRPVANTTALVLDRRLRLVPSGVAGELCLAGLSLATGYHARPAQTAAAFVPHPCPRRPGDRIYRTGDRVVQRHDGTLRFLGRLDRQVKLRGLRIETGEIEAKLRQLPEIEQAVVALLPSNPGGDDVWVAWVVPREGTNPDGGALRRALAEQLPTAMIPQRFTAVSHLPTTTAGKIDYRALSRLEPSVPETPLPKAVTTPTEAALSEIWSEVLGLDTAGDGAPGADADFFALGGHSLLATQVVARIRRCFEVEIPLRRLFEEPTLGRFARAVDTLRRRGGADLRSPVRPIPDDVPPVLSFSQQRLWFFHQLEPDSPAYHIPAARWLVGPLDAAAFEQALRQTIRRHRILHSRFPTFEGEPRVVVDPTTIDPVAARIDLRGLPSKRGPELARQLATAAARRPFDLAEGRLLRCLLLRLADDRWLLALVAHHIVSDGTSQQLLFRELRLRYSALREHRQLPLSPPAIQYQDFAHWQRRELGDSALAALRDFWSSKLAGLADLALPTDRPRPPVESHRPGLEILDLDPGLVESLNALGRRCGTTLFTTCLSLFVFFLHRLTGQRDPGVGTAVSDRAQPETEEMVGPAINTVVLRTSVPSGSKGMPATVGDLLHETRRTLLEALDHRELPFERLVEALAPERDLSRHPIYQASFALHEVSGDEQLGGDVEMRRFAFEAHAARLDLELALWRAGSTLGGALIYAADLFDPTTMRRWSRALARLLRHAADGPQTPLDSLRLESPAERHAMLYEWNDTAPRRLPSTGGLYERLTANRRPATAPLLTFAGETWSRGRVEEEVETLATALAGRGVMHGDRVGVLMPPSPHLLCSLLAVLRLGAAYVPFDPEVPAERMCRVLEDSGARWILACSAAPERPPGVAWIDPLDPGSPTGALAPPTATREDLAYVIYTSGSTGRPKGVEVTQGSVIDFLESMARRPGLGPDDRLLAVTTLSFDIAVLELFLPLVTGAELVLVEREVAQDGHRLGRALARHDVSCLQGTPATWRLLLAADWPGYRPSRRSRLRALCGGEALGSELAAQLLARGVELWNVYGPTETTVWSTVRRVAGDPGLPILPIGRPITATRLYLVDQGFYRSPSGAVGELCIAGAGLARGYRSRPALTAEHWVPDPWSTSPGGRLYRTGDLARYRADGEVEFLGRRDHQVKIRGFRIELGEIEAALETHPAVGEAAVTVAEQGPGDGLLVAHLVWTQGPVGPEAGVKAAPDPRIESLREDLAIHLPTYMIPTVWQPLDALPRLPNGKIDRRALPTLERAPTARFIAPSTRWEHALVAAWSEVLNLEAIGIDDDFFALGGDSIRSIQVVSRLRRQGLEIAPRDLFRYSTPRELAARMERVGAGSVERTVRPRPRDATAIPFERFSLVDPDDREALAAWLADPDVEDIYPVSPTQHGLLYFRLYAPDSTAYFEQMTFRLSGALDPVALADAWDQLCRRYPVLRTELAWRDLGRPYQVVRRRVELPWTHLDLRSLPAARQRRRVLEWCREQRRLGFDLARAPLQRLGLVRLGDDTHLMIWSYHHVLLDGWSLSRLCRDLAHLYRCQELGLVPRLPPAPAYRDYIAWLAERDREATARFWRRSLSGFRSPTPLPEDRSDPHAPHHAGDVQSLGLALGVEPTRRLLARARRWRLTPNTLIQAVWALTLARFSGSRDVVFGATLAGRPGQVPEVEAMVGLFISTLPVRVELDTEPELRPFLAALQAWNADLREHADVSLFELHRWSGVPAGETLFSSALLYQSFPRLGRWNPEESKLTFHATGFYGHTSYPLTLTVHPGERFRLALAYDRRRFDRTTVARLLDLSKTLALALAEGDCRRLDDLPALPPAARHQLVVEWNDGRAVPPLDWCREIGRVARRAPQRSAVCSDEGEWTYEELDSRSSWLAARLVEYGAGPERPVALLLVRSFELILAMVAAAKALSAWVPLDPLHPAERSHGILGETRAVLLLTLRRLAGDLGSLHIPTLVLDDPESASTTPRAATNARPRPREAIEAPAQAGAYVLYTSGSTGRPKGVLTPRRALDRYVAVASRRFALGPADRVLQFASPVFDTSVEEIATTLASGATLVLRNERMLESPATFLAACRDQAITVLDLPTAYWHTLITGLEHDRLEIPASLRLVILGGEAARPDALATWRRKAPKTVRLLNTYGPTEATVVATTQDLTTRRTGEPPATRVSIGRPLPGRRTYVLDSRGRWVPPGARGQLVLAGDGLARGYVGRPRETAARFTPDPAPRHPGARIYQTGDEVRQSVTGDFEWLGRLDRQVKIRGLRIELGEIEAVLLEQPACDQAVVVVAGDPRPELVAFVVTDDPSNDSADTLREPLRARLPFYMVPSRVLRLEELPLTERGKVDRQVLVTRAAAALAEDRPRAVGNAPPRDELEAAMVALWCEVLGLEALGIHDEYFALGGDSLSAVRLLAEIDRHFEVSLSLAHLFQDFTVAGTAEMVRRTRPSTALV